MHILTCDRPLLWLKQSSLMHLGAVHASIIHPLVQASVDWKKNGLSIRVLTSLKCQRIGRGASQDLKNRRGVRGPPRSLENL